MRDTLHVDAEGGWLSFTAGGREAGRDPYYRHLYRCTLDGADLTLLTPEEADHSVTFSPSGAYFVDTYSRVDLPPISVLRRADGTLVDTLEEADIAALTEIGWRAPERFTVKARDGVTDLYGCIFRPTQFRCQPDVSGAGQHLSGAADHPHAEDVRRRRRRAGATSGRIRRWRNSASSSSLSTAWARRTAPKPSSMSPTARTSARRAAWRTISPACGNWRRATPRSISPASASTATQAAGSPPPTRCSVSRISTRSPSHRRATTIRWATSRVGASGTSVCRRATIYAGQINAALAGNLRGKLLLVHGELDDNVHPSLTMQLVDALIAANKEFDLLIIPFTNHSLFDLRWGLAEADRFVSLSHPYFVRRRWDYFVTHLLGATPPPGYAITPMASAP